MTLPDNTPEGQVDEKEKGQTPSPTPTPEPITRTQLEEFRNSFTEEIKGMVSKGFSGVQSNTSKMVNNLRQEVDTRMVDYLNQMGIKVTPEAMAEANRQIALDDMIAERTAKPPGVNDPAGPGEPPAGDAPQDGYAQYMTQLGEKLCKKLDVEFTEKDPEWAEIDKAAQTGDEILFLDTIREQAKAKKNREASSRDARLPAAPDKGGPANPLDGLSKDELWQRVQGG